jgi:hypothetical protein
MLKEKRKMLLGLHIIPSKHGRLVLIINQMLQNVEHVLFQIIKIKTKQK